MRSYSDISELVTGYPLDKVIVLDTETTGLDCYTDEILSIGITDGYGRELFYSLIKPSRTRSWPDAERINGISPRNVATAPAFDDCAGTIADLLTGDVMIVGYNLEFDTRFVSRGIGSYLGNETFDVMKEYSRVHGASRRDSGAYKWSKLTDCAACYGYDFPAHNSLEDAKATAHCYRSLICDPLYIEELARRDASASPYISLKQTNATRQSISEIFPDGISAKFNGTLALGSVTRGKNAGMPRYECMVGGKCVGVSSMSAVDSIRRYYGLDKTDAPPESVPASVEISVRDSSPSCSATISDASRLERLSRPLVERMISSGLAQTWAMRLPGTNRVPANRIAPVETARQTPDVGRGRHFSQQPEPSKKERSPAFRIAVIATIVLATVALIILVVTNWEVVVGIVTIGILVSIFAGKKKRR